MTEHTIRHVDAFTARPLEGNPAAVVDGTGLSPDVMQRIALNQHLSETVFLLPPESPEHHARLRIFTPWVELPFAGHPTLAAAHILASEGIASAPSDGPLLLETGAGVIPVAVEPGEPPSYTMTQAPPSFRATTFDRAAIAAAIGLAESDVTRAEEVSTGVFWLVAQVASLEAMLRVRPDATRLAAFPDGLAIFCIGATAPDADVHVRAFAVYAGILEDPVTGSANGCIGAFIARHGLRPARDGEVRYVAEQGLEMGQPGRVRVCARGAGESARVDVGGHAVTVLRGSLLLD